MKKIIIITLVCAFILTVAVFAYFQLQVEMYSPDGAVVSVFSFNVDKYKNMGLYDEPVTTVYNIDGKNKIVAKQDFSTWQDKGWYDKPVSVLYDVYGKNRIVYKDEVKSDKADGWFIEPVAIMNKGSEIDCVLRSQVDLRRNDGWLINKYCFGLSKLADEIDKYLENKKGEYGIYIKNLDSGEFLVINDKKYFSASIIKVFVMASIYNEIFNENIEYTPSVQKYLNSMITVSDNYSSNRLVGVLGKGNYREGFDIENKFSKSIGCINTEHLSLFSGCGYFVAYGNNYVSPYDCGIILEKIYNNTLVSREYSKEMLSLLKNQTRRNKIPYYLPEDVVIANKTGETSTIENDIGIVYSPNCDYIICVMTNNAYNGIGDIREISKITYDYFN